MNKTFLQFRTEVWQELAKWRTEADALAASGDREGARRQRLSLAHLERTYRQIETHFDAPGEDDTPRPGELCACGRAAVTVRVTEKLGRIGYCKTTGLRPVKAAS